MVLEGFDPSTVKEMTAAYKLSCLYKLEALTNCATGPFQIL